MNELDLEYYGMYAPLLQKTEQNILNELTNIIHSISRDEEHTPAEHIRSRIKSAASMQEKLLRHGVSTKVQNALYAVSDAVGIRVVTHFVGDVYVILQKIQSASSLKIITIKDYISRPKENGYRSLHIIVEVPFGAPGIPTIQAEIQLRTIAMDCWASLEHQMKYKKNINNTELIVSELRRCADEMASTDLTMQTIRQMIQEGQAKTEGEKMQKVPRKGEKYENIIRRG